MNATVRILASLIGLVWIYVLVTHPDETVQTKKYTSRLAPTRCQDSVDLETPDQRLVKYSRTFFETCEESEEPLFEEDPEEDQLI